MEPSLGPYPPSPGPRPVPPPRRASGERKTIISEEHRGFWESCTDTNGRGPLERRAHAEGGKGQQREVSGIMMQIHGTPHQHAEESNRTTEEDTGQSRAPRHDAAQSHGATEQDTGQSRALRHDAAQSHGATEQDTGQSRAPRHDAAQSHRATEQDTGQSRAPRHDAAQSHGATGQETGQSRAPRHDAAQSQGATEQDGEHHRPQNDVVQSRGSPGQDGEQSHPQQCEDTDQSSGQTPSAATKQDHKALQQSSTDDSHVISQPLHSVPVAWSVATPNTSQRDSVATSHKAVQHQNAVWSDGALEQESHGPSQQGSLPGTQGPSQQGSLPGTQGPSQQGSLPGTQGPSQQGSLPGTQGPSQQGSLPDSFRISELDGAVHSVTTQDNKTHVTQQQGNMIPYPLSHDSSQQDRTILQNQSAEPQQDRVGPGFVLLAEQCTMEARVAENGLSASNSAPRSDGPSLAAETTQKKVLHVAHVIQISVTQEELTPQPQSKTIHSSSEKHFTPEREPTTGASFFTSPGAAPLQVAGISSQPCPGVAQLSTTGTPSQPSPGVAQLSTTGTLSQPSPGVALVSTTGTSSQPSPGVAQLSTTGTPSQPSPGVAQLSTTGTTSQLSPGVAQLSTTGATSQLSPGVAQLSTTGTPSQSSLEATSVSTVVARSNTAAAAASVPSPVAPPRSSPGGASISTAGGSALSPVRVLDTSSPHRNMSSKPPLPTPPRSNLYPGPPPPVDADAAFRHETASLLSYRSKGPAPDTLSYLDSVSLMSGTLESLSVLDDNSSVGSDSEINGAAYRKTDKYGFLGGNQYSSNGEMSIPVEISRQRELKWLDMFNHWDKWLSRRFQKVKLRCRKGIPSSLRSKAWQHLSNSHELLARNPGKFEELERHPGDPKWLDVIEKDLHRQFPFHEMFAARGGHGQQDLYRILKAYTIYRPEEGYCQAQAPVAAVLLMHMPAEQAFWCLVQICDKYLPGYYSAGLEAIQLDGEIFFALLRRVCPMAYRHLKRFKIDPILYMTEWFMCIFSRTLPWASVLRVWDMFFCEGVKIVFRVGLVLLRHTLGSRDKLQSCQGMYETMEKLRSLPPHCMHEDILLPEVSSLPVTDALIERESNTQLRKWRENRGELQYRPSRRLHGARQIQEEKQRLNPSLSGSRLSLASLRRASPPPTPAAQPESMVVSEGLRPVLPSPTANKTPLGPPKAETKKTKEKQREQEKRREKEEKEERERQRKREKEERERERKREKEEKQAQKDKVKVDSKPKKERKFSFRRKEPSSPASDLPRKGGKGPADGEGGAVHDTYF